MSKTYRPKNRDLWANVACLTFFLIVGALSVAFFLFQPEFRGQGNRFAVATGAGLFWAFFASLSAWEIVAWSRQELTISGQRIAKKGVFGETVLHHDAVREVRWQTMHRGRIELLGKEPDGREAKLAIDLPAGDPREALEILRSLRNELAHAEHVGWDRFCRRYAIPLRDAANGVKRPLRPDERLLTRKRWGLIFAPSIVICGLVAAGIAYATGRVAPFAVVGLLSAMWAVLHFGWPREGTIARRRSREENRLIAVVGGATLLLLVSLGVAAATEFTQLSPFERRIVDFWAIGVFLAWLAALGWAMVRVGETQKDREAAESLGAAEEWEEGEEIVFVD